jgi:hypothetical protein
MPEGALRDRAMFWVGVAAVVAVIGGLIAGVGIAEAVPVGHTVWSDAWFDIGAAVVGVGVLMLVWAVVLQLAHGHAMAHMCPDPAAHEARRAPRRRRPTVANLAQEQQSTFQVSAPGVQVEGTNLSVEEQRLGAQR